MERGRDLNKDQMRWILVVIWYLHGTLYTYHDQMDFSNFHFFFAFFVLLSQPTIVHRQKSSEEFKFKYRTAKANWNPNLHIGLPLKRESWMEHGTKEEK